MGEDSDFIHSYVPRVSFQRDRLKYHLKYKRKKNLRKKICISNFSSHHILLLFQVWVIQGILLTMNGYQGNSVCECNTKSVGEAKQRIRTTFNGIKDSSVHLWFGKAISALGVCTHLYSLKHQSKNIKWKKKIWYLALSMPWKIGQSTTGQNSLPESVSMHSSHL